MPSALAEAQDRVKKLSFAALETTEDASLTFDEQYTKVKALEEDLVKAEDEVQKLQYVDERRKALMAKVAKSGGDMAAAPSEDRDASPRGQDTNGPSPRLRGTFKSLGQQFVESQHYKSVIEAGGGKLPGGKWTTGNLELKSLLRSKTTYPTDSDTVWEGAPNISGAPGTGGALVATPTVLPGIVDVRFPQLVVSDLFPQAMTDTPLIRFIQESPTSLAIGAAEVAETAPYGETQLVFTKADAALTKIATFLPISDEMLEDVTQAQAYIDARLQLFVQQREQFELLLGDGSGPDLSGIVTQATATTVPVGGGGGFPASDNGMDAIYRQITNIRITQFLEPDGIIIDPASWQDITLAKNSIGAYYANGPFMTQGTAPTLWNIPVCSTASMNGQGSTGVPSTTSGGRALVGCFQLGAQIFRRGGLTVEASNSHLGYFTEGIIAIRAEERVALVVYRPAAFGQVTGL